MLYLHAVVHALAIGSDLLVLQPRLDQIQREDTCHSNDSSNSTVYDLRKQAAIKMISGHLLVGISLCLAN